MRRSLALAGLLLLPVAVQPAEAHRRHGRYAPHHVAEAEPA